MAENKGKSMSLPNLDLGEYELDMSRKKKETVSTKDTHTQIERSKTDVKQRTHRSRSVEMTMSKDSSRTGVHETTHDIHQWLEYEFSTITLPPPRTISFDSDSIASADSPICRFRSYDSDDEDSDRAASARVSLFKYKEEFLTDIEKLKTEQSMADTLTTPKSEIIRLKESLPRSADGSKTYVEVKRHSEVLDSMSSDTSDISLGDFIRSNTGAVRSTILQDTTETDDEKATRGMLSGYLSEDSVLRQAKRGSRRRLLTYRYRIRHSEQTPLFASAYTLLARLGCGCTITVVHRPSTFSNFFSDTNTPVIIKYEMDYPPKGSTTLKRFFVWTTKGT